MIKIMVCERASRPFAFYGQCDLWAASDGSVTMMSFGLRHVFGQGADITLAADGVTVFGREDDRSRDATKTTPPID